MSKRLITDTDSSEGKLRFDPEGNMNETTCATFDKNYLTLKIIKK